MIRDKVIEILKQALADSAIEDEGIHLAHPSNPNHGDYATSVAMKHAKSRTVSPMVLAQQIADRITPGDVISRVEVAAPGFINLFLTTNVLHHELSSINEDYGHIANPQARRILIEYGQPNTHKLPHIGHLFSYIFGESLARILEHNSNTVTRVNYQGDIGLHVAKCLWYAWPNVRQLETTAPLKTKIMFLQKGYQEGSAAYENDPDAKIEIDNINNALYQNKDEELTAYWRLTRQWCVDYYDEFQKSLGISYDRLYFESQTWKEGLQIVTDHIGDVFTRSQGAVVFEGEQYGLHTRVFINKHGNPTYEGKDVGLMALKNREQEYDLSLVTTASEQNEYWRVVKKTGELVFPNMNDKMKHLGFGMINLTTGKMSSRTGDIVDAVGLIDMTKSAILKAYDTTDESTADIIAQAAIKYSFLKSDPYKNMAFDLDTSIAREGDSGPYLLYTYVRTQSILSKLDVADSTGDIQNTDINEDELRIMRLVYQYPEVVQLAATQYSPSVLCSFLYELAQSYNLFYQKHSVNKAGDSSRALRIRLTQVTGILLKSGLQLLGISTVDRM